MKRGSSCVVERVYRAGISTHVYEGRFSNPYVMEKRRGMSTFQDRFPSCSKKGSVQLPGLRECDGVRRPVLVRSSVWRMMFGQGFFPLQLGRPRYVDSFGLNRPRDGKRRI